jgi:hypothetical protein
MVLMAGAITEQHLLFEERGGDGSDMAQVDRLIPHDPGDRRKSRLAAATLDAGRATRGSYRIIGIRASRA